MYDYILTNKSELIIIGSIIFSFITHIIIFIYVSKKRNKDLNDKMVMNAANLLNKYEELKSRKVVNMDKDLEKVGRYLAKKIDELEEKLTDKIENAKEETIGVVEDIVGVDEEKEESEEEKSPFDDEEEDIGEEPEEEKEELDDYSGERQVKTEKKEEEPPKKKKRGLFGKKKEK